MVNRSIAILGGTFDPIHFGHLRTALEVKQTIPVDEVRLVPCGLPAHRDFPQTSTQHRLQMLELAIEEAPDLVLDPREISREGHSYSVETLESLRVEFGDLVPIYMVIGMDSYMSLAGWHRWQELLNFVHIFVVNRPGSRLETSSHMSSYLKEHRAINETDYINQSHGKIIVKDFSPLDISSTRIRELLAAGKSPRYLLPEQVLNYIRDNGLYDATTSQTNLSNDFKLT